MSRLQVELFGSLALTGLGHRTDRAIIAGLCGQHPRTVDPDSIDPLLEHVKQSRELKWSGKQLVQFDLPRDLLFHRSTFLPQHPNGLRCSAFDSDGEVVLSKEYFSVGGGFVVDADELNADATLVPPEENVPLPFTSAEELLSICHREQLTIAEVIQCNELCFRSETEIARGLDEIWSVMRACIEAGCYNDGILPGGLVIRRLAPAIYRKITA